ncbi:hypothetical protein, partial [Falsigemmobacter intermedius]|uniref:hypothetical protein n=1 Tax=Falsigemmobacter intermedius TaxID=1553448 RepID=UPI003F10CB9A
IVLPAYDVLRRVGIPVARGPGLIVSAPDEDQGLPSLAVSNFGWLHCSEDIIPVVELPAHTTPEELRRKGWLEVNAQLTALSATSEQKAAFLVALQQNCPDDLLGLFGVTSLEDIEPLRRLFRLRRSRLEAAYRLDAGAASGADS